MPTTKTFDYSYSDSPYFYTVAATGVYDLNAFGGMGGDQVAGSKGGYGAEVGGNFSLTAGDKLDIFVGGQGGGGESAGGGGGTFVLLQKGSTGAFNLILAAGGGGGNGDGDPTQAQGGLITQGSGNPGKSGDYTGGGGAGHKGNGGSDTGGGGSNISGGYLGGHAYIPTDGGLYSGNGQGGFGGGGGGGQTGGGGGGGYTGGNGGYETGGGGGSSFDSGTVIAAQTVAANNHGAGKLVLTTSAISSYSFTGTRSFVTIAQTGVYDLEAFGAQGGALTGGGAGGKGAEAGGSFNLTAGEKLEIIVGGAGSASAYAGGGGGGSFVLANTGAGGAYVPLLIAGGGGGGYKLSGGQGGAGAAGNGSGGGAGNYSGGGGSGVKGNGGSSLYGGAGGRNISGLYAGGAGVSNNFSGSPPGGAGGFGGGGGGSGGATRGGGGGGGYTGGAGGSGSAGAGGTSFDAGTVIAAQTSAGVQSGNGSVVIIACYARGTLILTTRGEMPVEVLAAGDTVVTAGGAHRAIRWLGRRSYAGRFLAANPAVQPIRFRAGSLGGGVPRRDLLVSPKHAMFLDGLLAPAECLVNEHSIVRERGWARVDYFHVELGSHDVILAEGAASESFVDDGSRGMFHNGREVAVQTPGEVIYCARRVESGYELDAIRRRLDEAACGLDRAG